MTSGRILLMSSRLRGPIELSRSLARRPIVHVVRTIRRAFDWPFEIQLVRKPRAPRVSRGLLATARRPLVASVGPELAASRAMVTLRAAATGNFAWKEKAQWARRLAHRQPDWNGRRIDSDAGLLDCRYVARISRAAWRAGRLPTGRQWGILEASLRRIYAELQEGR